MLKKRRLQNSDLGTRQHKVIQKQMTSFAIIPVSMQLHTAMHTILPLFLHLSAMPTPVKYTSCSLALHIEVQYQKLRLLCPVPTANSTHQFGLIGTNPPHHPTTPTTV